LCQHFPRRHRPRHQGISESAATTIVTIIIILALHLLALPWQEAPSINQRCNPPLLLYRSHLQLVAASVSTMEEAVVVLFSRECRNNKTDTYPYPVILRNVLRLLVLRLSTLRRCNGILLLRHHPQ
jgi:hypothetical protein